MSRTARRVARTITERRHHHAEVDAASLARVTSHPSGEPHFGRTARNRFDSTGPTPAFGVSYCAPTFLRAFAESILHVDKRFDSRRNRWVVSRSGVIDAEALFERSGVTTQQLPGAYIPLTKHLVGATNEAAEQTQQRLEFDGKQVGRWSRDGAGRLSFRSAPLTSKTMVIWLY